MITVGWSIGMQLTWWNVHQTWTLAYAGIKKTDNKGTYNLTNHLMKNFIWFFETIITLASMTYIVGLSDAYELYLGDDNVFNGLRWMLGFLHITYDRDWLLFRSIFTYLCEWLYIHVIFYVYILLLVLLSLKLYMYCLILQQKETCK